MVHGSVVCPVAAIKAYIEAAGITEGHLFRSIRKGGRTIGASLSAQAVANVVKDASCRVRLSDPTKTFALRSGASAATVGVPLPSFRANVQPVSPSSSKDTHLLLGLLMCRRTFQKCCRQNFINRGNELNFDLVLHVLWRHLHITFVFLRHACRRRAACRCRAAWSPRGSRHRRYSTRPSRHCRSTRWRRGPPDHGLAAVRCRQGDDALIQVFAHARQKVAAVGVNAALRQPFEKVGGLAVAEYSSSVSATAGNFRTFMRRRSNRARWSTSASAYTLGHHGSEWRYQDAPPRDSSSAG